MTFPEWTKPGVYGALGGAILMHLMQKMTGMAQTHAAEEVTLAMVPVCLNAAAADPARAAKLASIQDASSYNRRKAMMATGWATFPGSDEPNRDLASACVDGLELNGS